MQVLRVNIKKGAVAQGQPRLPVEFVSHGIELLLGVATLMSAFCEMLA